MQNLTKQARAKESVHFGKDSFSDTSDTSLRWLGNGGLFINSRGCTVMCDPLLKGFDMPLLIKIPILPEEVPHLDN
jgi:L-ascorbate metabolism protein UlaG (beta-lactamase superfamily)